MTLCQICGEQEATKQCTSCDNNSLLCLSCDNTWHGHFQRKNHKRDIVSVNSSETPTTLVTAAGTQQAETNLPELSANSSLDLTTDAESEPVYSPRIEPSVEALIGFKYDAVLIFASKDKYLARGIMKEMNTLRLANGRNVKVCCFDNSEFVGQWVSKPRRVLEKCRFVFSVLTDKSYDDMDTYINMETVARTKPAGRMYPLFTAERTECHIPDGLACEDPIKWYETEEERHTKLLMFLDYHICPNSSDATQTSNTSYRSTPPAGEEDFVSAANAVPGSKQGLEQTILVGCTHVNIVYERKEDTSRKVQMDTPTSPENNPDDRYDIIEDGPQDTSRRQGQGSGQEDGTQTHFRTNSSSSSDSDEWHDAVTHHPDDDATLTHPKSIASEDGRANSHLELPALGMAELYIKRDQGSGREEGRSCEEFSGFRLNQCLKYLLRKSIVNTSEIQFHEKIVELAKSVGCICSSNTRGTAFRVGNDSIMTCWHVINDIIEKGVFLGEKREEKILDNEKVWVQFRYKPGEEHHPDNNHRFLFSLIQYRNPELDFAIIKLKVTEGKELPPAIKRFTAKGGHDLLHLIGHDRGKAKELDPACRIEHPTLEKIQECDQQLRQKLRGLNIGTVSEFYEGMAARGRIHFHCAFQKGASGSPGVVFSGEELHVVTMLCRGYPNFYYEFQDEQRNQFGIEDKYFIEEGIDMNEVYNHLAEFQRDIFLDIFGES